MDDELEKLEAELHRLRPMAPRRTMRAKLERSLRARALEGEIIRVARWALPIAAAVALAALIARKEWSPAPENVNNRAEQVASEAPAFKPVAAENLLIASRDEGYVTFADGTPARRVREAYLDTITWQNPRTNASLTWTVPREQVRIVPVSIQ